MVPALSIFPCISFVLMWACCSLAAGSYGQLMLDILGKRQAKCSLVLIQRATVNRPNLHCNRSGAMVLDAFVFIEVHRLACMDVWDCARTDATRPHFFLRRLGARSMTMCQGLGAVATYIVFIMDYVPQASMELMMACCRSRVAFPSQLRQQVCALWGDDNWCTDKLNVVMLSIFLNS